jgi:Mrr N-terminal domain
MSKRIAEAELIIPTLELLDAAPNGEMQTTDIIEALEKAFSPKGEDSEILEGRHDTKFSQKVRNLKSHKTLLKAGLAEEIEDGFRITEKGRALVKSLKD